MTLMDIPTPWFIEIDDEFCGRVVVFFAKEGLVGNFYKAVESAHDSSVDMPAPLAWAMATAALGLVYDENFVMTTVKEL